MPRNVATEALGGLKELSTYIAGELESLPGASSQPLASRRD
jgi:hypothetical protein